MDTIGTTQPAARFPPVVYEMPVPGALTVVKRLPLARRPVRKPLVPTEYPTPDLLRLIRKGPKLRDRRKRQPTRASLIESESVGDHIPSGWWVTRWFRARVPPPICVG